jgi:MFS family permease
MQIKVNIDIAGLKINRIIKFFVMSDLMLWGGWGLISPIFAIYLVEEIPGATIATAGGVVAVYWIVKSLVQLPVAVALDKHQGEKDDFYTLIFSLVLAGFSALAFLLVKDIFSLYVVSFLHGLAFGLYAPAWSGIFSRHMDKDHFAFDWSLDSTTIGLASGVAAFIGGWLATAFGFSVVFILASVFSFFSALLLLMVPDLVMPKATIKIPFRFPLFTKIMAPVEVEKREA